MTATIEELAERALARRTMDDFCARMDPTYLSLAHTRFLNRHLDALAHDDIEKLAIFMPPRHGKTYHAAERFPAYFLGRRPSSQVIISSYTIDRARASSRRARGLMREPSWPFGGCKLAEDPQAVDEWHTVAGGIVKAAGVSGSMTGFGAHLLVIDDPIKDRAEANSETMREQIWDWYTEVARTRLMRGGKELLMMTRWHDDDLAGRILNSAAASKWTVLRLPALAEEDDPLGRSVGQPLAPELGLILPRPDLGEISTRGFEALYQGNPTPAEGDLFHAAWFERYYPWGSRPRGQTSTCAFLDGAWKDGVSNDRSALAFWGTDGVAYFLLDAWADRLQYPDLKARVIGWYEQERPDALVVEDAASGTPLVQELKRTTNIPIIAVPPNGSKEARAEAVTPLFEAGKIVVPHGAPWLGDWVNEHLRFPAGMHDDYVDTTSGALAYLSNRSFGFGSVRR